MKIKRLKKIWGRNSILFLSAVLISLFAYQSSQVAWASNGDEFSRYSGTEDNSDGIVLSACASARITAPSDKSPFDSGSNINFNGVADWIDQHFVSNNYCDSLETNRPGCVDPPPTPTASIKSYKWYQFTYDQSLVDEINNQTCSLSGLVQGRCYCSGRGYTLIGTGKNISHDFSATGNKGICLEVEDNFGYKDDVAEYITIQNPGGRSCHLTVTKLGTGSGTVSSSDREISCGSSCNHQYDISEGTSQSVNLTASNASGSSFSGWSGGGCSGSGSCKVTFPATGACDITVNATFDTSACTCTCNAGLCPNEWCIQSPCGAKCYGTKDCSQSGSGWQETAP